MMPNEKKFTDEKNNEAVNGNFIEETKNVVSKRNLMYVHPRTLVYTWAVMVTCISCFCVHRLVCMDMRLSRIEAAESSRDLRVSSEVRNFCYYYYLFYY